MLRPEHPSRRLGEGRTSGNGPVTAEVRYGRIPAAVFRPNLSNLNLAARDLEDAARMQ